MHATSVSVLLTIRTSLTPVSPASVVSSRNTSSRHGVPTTVMRVSVIGNQASTNLPLDLTNRVKLPRMITLSRASGLPTLLTIAGLCGFSSTAFAQPPRPTPSAVWAPKPTRTPVYTPPVRGSHRTSTASTSPRRPSRSPGGIWHTTFRRRSGRILGVLTAAARCRARLISGAMAIGLSLGRAEIGDNGSLDSDLVRCVPLIGGTHYAYCQCHQDSLHPYAKFCGRGER